MKFSVARRRCSAVNALLKKMHLKSYATVETKDSGNHYLVIHHYEGETLPSKLDSIKQIPQEKTKGSPYVKETPNTPSDAGKWIDKPLSIVNRRVDNSGALGYPRSNSEVQDIVKRVATPTKNRRKSIRHSGEKMSMRKIAARLRLLAKVERIEEVDKLLREMSRIMKTSDQIGSAISTLFDRFSESYDASILPRLKEKLTKAGFKSRDNIVKLVDQIAVIMKNADVKQGENNVDPQVAQETQELISELVKVLPDISRNLGSLDLKDEAEHLRSVQSDLVDIGKVVARLVN